MYSVLNKVCSANMKYVPTIIVFSAILTLTIHSTQAMWPPPFKIDLKYNEIFDLSDTLSDSDQEIIDISDDNDEMISSKELEKFKLQDDSKKYSMLHRMIMKKNDLKRSIEEPVYNKKYQKKPLERPLEEMDIPYEAGFVDKNGNLNSKGKQIYINPFLRQRQVRDINKKEERETSDDTPSTSEKDYDYHEYKKEYNKRLQVLKSSNDTVHYTTKANEEESIKGQIKTFIEGDAKENNCSLQERKGIGFKAIECIFKDLTDANLSQSKKRDLYRRIGTIILIWIFVYLFVAIPCWCQRGWCCCCFQCKFCKPREKIDLAKRFLLDNPLGVYHAPDHEVITYVPTSYESYLQKKLETEINRL